MFIAATSVHYLGRVLNYGGSCAFLCAFGFESSGSKKAHATLELRFSPVRGHYRHPTVVRHRANRAIHELQQFLDYFRTEAALFTTVPDYECN